MTMKKKATKATNKKSNPKDGANTARRRYELEVEAALDCEHRSQWAEAAAAWGRAQELTGDRGERKEAAGRKAAAKVRASAKTSTKAAPLDKQLAENSTAEANTTSWDQAMPEPGYVPPAGTGDEGAHGRDDAADEDATDEGAAAATPAPTGEQGATDAAKPKRARKPTEPAAPHEIDPRLPPVGTVLKKVDRNGNERVRCTIAEGGVEYAGTIYKSLSGAAMAAAKNLGLTNKTQNGFVFWGLSKPPRRPSNPLSALERAWQRYQSSAQALIEDGVTDQNRSAVISAIHKHAQVIDGLREKFV